MVLLAWVCVDSLVVLKGLVKRRMAARGGNRTCVGALNAAVHSAPPSLHAKMGEHCGRRHCNRRPTPVSDGCSFQLGFLRGKRH